MNNEWNKPRTWPDKFRDAFRGCYFAVQGQSSFAAHIFMSVAVLVAGVVLRVNLWEWCILLMCIAMVWSAETLNSSLEAMARAVDKEYNPELGKSLDMASGAVLMASIGAALVGAIIFIYRLGVMLGKWS